MKLNITAVALRSARPKYAYGERALLRLDSGEEIALLRATVPSDIPDNAIVTKADLVMYVQTAMSGSRSIYATMCAAGFKVSTATWNNRPAGTGTTRSVTVGAAVVGQEVRLDVLPHVQAIVAGTAVNRGWVLTTSDTTNRAFYGSAGSTLKPYLDLEYVLPSDEPTDLVPNGGAVSIAKPTLTFTVPDDTIAIQVGIDAGANLASLDWDSGEVPATAGSLDLSATTFPGLVDGATTFWAARAKTSSGWSDWSDWATLPRASKPTVTITSPLTTTGDKTPPITWTAAGQTAWAVLVYDDVTGKLLDSSGTQAGTDHEWTPAKGMTRTGQTARIVVRVYDDVDREATPGDPIYAAAALVTELVALSAAPPVTTLTATSGITPWVRLAWSGAEADEWQIVRNGKWIDRVDGAVRAWRDFGAVPRHAYTYQVFPVTDSGVGANSPKVTITPRPGGLWLYDGTEGVFVTDHDLDVSWDEQAVVHDVIGGAPVRRRAGSPPPRGTVTGTIVDGAKTDLRAADIVAIALSFKGSSQGRVYRMAYGDKNIPVTIGDLMVEPLAVDEPQTYEISFKFWQTVDELPWDD